MKAMIGQVIPRGEDGSFLSGLSRPIFADVPPESDSEEFSENERFVLDGIAKVFASAYGKKMRAGL